MGRHAQRIGRGNQIGLVRAQEIQHRAQQAGIAQTFAQGIRGEPGQGQQPFGTIAIGQNPAKRRQRQGGGIDNGG